MSDHNNANIGHDYEDSLDDWRASSAIALEKKSQDWNSLQYPQRQVRKFRTGIDAANQAIDDAHQDQRYVLQLQQINQSPADTQPVPTIDQIVELSIEQYGISDGNARAYASRYKKTRAQLDLK